MKDIVRGWRHIPQRYNLIGSKCLQCGEVFFPMRVICPKCRRKGKLEDIKFSGNGKIHSYSVIHTPTDEFKNISPYAVAIIELEEGAKITSQIVDCNIDDVEIGQDVELVFRKIRAEGDEGVISYGYKFKLKQ
ncbi:Zn-ribbon domain-containing OB-fold protein [Methanobacterium petrolearium]|uniref:Zn-ribbon domain-containing OB-fold protein n=1 Tax=Methanobacterium petrolearium TaxID=710190 RepID=UPI001AE5C36A|nr:Zn-ribbon domain-containing OB-fold protein [Methanobacterium petrolearium]MBP1944732.1 putative OB-fold protein [Methanobacterium petrolearium]BDZ69998.1 transcriptional regulator [Methanobacterium petrolearium]